ncbi:MAG: hypothetical protein KF760_33175 [Candidatus Eremiobacteraeota bacterium]|nr:hypothetical protein [Candidatus Eremiobacteraeota bacterium]MCW5872591.1 hypothetical protein [Candidatus Eremiobacteraeota bacterium]
MLRHLPLLLKLYQTVQIRHLRLAAILLLLALCGGGSALGALSYGWQGGVLVPLALLLAFGLGMMVSLGIGMHSHRRNRPRAAVLFLAPAAMLGRGPAHSALLENRNKVVALVMQKMAMNFLSGPR